MKKWIWIHRREIVQVWDCLGIALMTGVETFWIRRTGEILVLPVFLLFIWFVVGGGPVFYDNVRRTRNANEQLNNFCDPEPMLRWAEEGLDYYTRSRQVRKLQRNLMDIYAINQSVALKDLGRYEQALAALRRVIPETANFQVQAAYYTNTAAYLIGLGQLTQAETAMEKARDFLAQSKKPAAAVYQDILLYNQMVLAIEKGETQGMEEKLLPLLAKATTEYARVCRHDTLAQLYLKEKRFSEAREHLEYVVAHGNKLYIRTEAEELLRTLPGEGEADSTYQSKYDQ